MTSSLTIVRLGHQGDGIAHSGSHEVFVPFTLPGEVITGALIDGRISGPAIITPSPDRVTAPCRHFKSCGGCALQHASDRFLAAWKADVVKTALAAQGITATISGVETSPPQSRRRATLAGRRTKKGALVGLHARAAETIVPIPSCTLLHGDILAAVPHLESLVKLGASRKGEVAIALTVSAAGLDVALSGVKPADGPLLTRLGPLAARFGFARLSWNGEVVATPHPPVQQFGRARVLPPAGGFLQATEAGEAALTTAVRRALGPARRIVDLFAGCGTFSLPLAENAEVAAFESDVMALEALQRGWRSTPGLKPVTCTARDLFRRPLLVDEFAGIDAVVIDPPRAGAIAQAEILAQSGVARIAFVSCNPVTFARDARVLIAGGYCLERLDIVDQFRWSPHVELVAGFSRAAG